MPWSVRVFLSANYSRVIAALIEFIMCEIAIRRQNYLKIVPYKTSDLFSLSGTY